jgi:exodeoxyribonuclease VII small subunit
MAQSSPKSRPSSPRGPEAPASAAPRGGTGKAREAEIADDLSFREAQTALELCLAQLQDQELDVEAMADLYRRAQRYAERCETVLRQVEQQVMLWDPEDQDAAPTPYSP